MKINEAMTADVKVADPNQSIREAAVLMAELDVGALPVGENDQLVGMITDRDIAIRAVAKGLKPDTRVRDVMSKDIKYCFDDEEVGEVAENMAEIKVRRLPVLNRQKRLVGIVAIADIAVDHGADAAGIAICGISQPGGEHSQTADGKRH